MVSESSTVPRRTGIVNSPSLQLLPSGQDVSEILQQTCGEISQTTTAEMFEVANSAVFWSMLQGLLPVYFYSWELQSVEAVIIHLLLHYFVLWRDGSERREDILAFEEYIERLKSRLAELEKKLYESRTEVNQMKAELEERREPDPEINRLMKLENEKLQRTHDVVSSLCASVFLVTYPKESKCRPQFVCMSLSMFSTVQTDFFIFQLVVVLLDHLFPFFGHLLLLFPFFDHIPS